jgi:hypothetical protein
MRSRRRSVILAATYVCSVAVFVFFSFSPSIAEPISISLLRPAGPAHWDDRFERIACTEAKQKNCRKAFDYCKRSASPHVNCNGVLETCLFRCGL